MIRRVWRRATQSWREAAAIIADVQARAQPPAPGSQPPPGAGPEPGAGETAHPPVSAGPERPVRPAPAPGRHGGIAYTLRVWNDGRMRLWNGDGTLFARRDCACPPHVDLSDEKLQRVLERWGHEH